MAHSYDYPRAEHTVDAVVFGIDMGAAVLRVLLIRRGKPSEPFFGSWALPGSFISIDEDLEAALRRSLRDETGLAPSYVEQLYTFGRPDRDPRGRVISTAYLALVRPDAVDLEPGVDTSEERWFAIDRLPPLGFDHREIVDLALTRLRTKLRWHPIGIDLLPPAFTLGDLQRVYQIVLDRPIDRRNFRKKLSAFAVLEATGKTAGSTRGPGGQLYRFNRQRYRRLQQQGLDFEL